MNTNNQMNALAVRPIPGAIGTHLFDQDAGFPEPAKVIAICQPIVAIADAIEAGEIEIDERGFPAIRDFRGEELSAPEALDGFASCFARMASKRGVSADMAPIHKVARRLEYGMEISVPDLAAFRAAINRCISIYMATPISDIMDCLTTEQIYIQFSRMGLAGRGQ